MAAFAGIFPRAAHPELIGIEDLDVVAPLQALVAAAPGRSAWGIRLAILVCALAPVFVLHRARTLSRIDGEARTHVMGRLLASSIYPIRQLALLLKMIGAFLLARAPEVKKAMLRGFEVPTAASSGTRLVDEGALVRRRPATLGAQGARDGRRIA